MDEEEDCVNNGGTWNGETCEEAVSSPGTVVDDDGDDVSESEDEG